MISKINIMKFIFPLSLLLIQLNASETVIIDHLEWQNDEESKEIRKNYNGAQKYCTNLSLGGHSDWTLPTLKQLQSLVDLKKYRPAVKEGITEISVLTFYWSSTTFVEDEKKAWYVFYKYGESYYANKGERYGVRCVREVY